MDAEKVGLWIIEDACHAPGGYFIDSKGVEQKCGNGQFADLAIFSFHPVKHIACGEGGMITTNNKALYERLLVLRTHGIVKNDDSYINSVDFAGGDKSYPLWYMEMQELGYNYRITDFQAALGLSQLNRAEAGIEKRRSIAKLYNDAFQDGSFVLGQSGVVEGHAYHLYILEVEDRLGLYNYLRNKKIFAQIHYIPCHLMPYYRDLGWKEGDRPNAETYYKHCISLPMYPTLSNEEQNFVIEKIKEFSSKMKHPKVGIISQARMTSTRLPGKILKEAKEIPLLQFHLNRLKDSGFPVIIATTTNHTDDPVIEVCNQNQVPFYRGDEDNVLERFYGAATEHNLEIVIRVTSDCPLIDGNIIQKAVQEFIQADDQMLYMSNGLSKTFPRGFDFEIFRYNLLKEAYEKADEQFEKEHVTPYLYTGKNPAINTKGFAYPKDYSAYRITVDTEDDFRLVQKLIEEFEADKKGIAQIIEILNKNPDLVKMNAHIEQKKLNE